MIQYSTEKLLEDSPPTLNMKARVKVIYSFFVL